MLKKDRIEMEKNVLVGVGEEEEEEEEEHEDRCREYRKGNWSLTETMVLIEAKKMDYERRAQRLKELSRGSSGIGSSRPQEMRWKWVEDCCWRHGCCRSQNQCNDRWDNLMRDYKKVRAYELSLSAGGNPGLSYWKLERHERKEKNLPSNLLPEIYEALTEVVQRRAMAEKASGGGACAAAARPVQEERQLGGASASMQHSSPGAGSQAPEPPLIAPPLPPYPPPHSRPMATVDSEDSQHSVSPERKRKRGGGGGSGSSSRSNTMELSSAISKCASIIAEALQAGEQKEETRHKDLVSIEERKAKLEESKSEASSQSMDGLASAINKLASSILGLATDRMQKLQK